jgi:hypothetical protein
MAEVLGVIASTIEIVKVVGDLKEICSYIKGAPAQLEHLLEEIECVEEVLKLLASHDAASPEFGGDVARKCRHRCEVAVKRLRAVCNELTIIFKQSRLRGSVKMLSKKAAISKACVEIEKTRNTLMLAVFAMQV